MGNYAVDIQAALVTQVKAEMAVRDLRQKDVAERLGMQTSTLSRYLSGRDIPVKVMFAIADALELPFVELVQRAERRLEAKDVL